MMIKLYKPTTGHENKLRYIYKSNSTKTIPYCSFVNNTVKIIRYQGKNSSSNTTEFLKKKLKKGVDEEIKMVVIIIKKVFDQTFPSL